MLFLTRAHSHDRPPLDSNPLPTNYETRALTNEPPRTTVQSDDLHPLSCRFIAGRFFRHAAISNIIKRSLDTAGLHAILEPVGLDRGDGRKPDGATSFPCKGGKALAWDSTCTDSFSAGNLYSINLKTGSESSAADDYKRRKYFQLVADFEIVPVAVEASGIIVCLF